MAKQKKQDQADVAEGSEVLSQELVESIGFKSERVEVADEFGKPTFKMKHSIFVFTNDLKSDTMVSQRLVLETTDSAEATLTFQMLAGKLILKEKDKENV